MARIDADTLRSFASALIATAGTSEAVADKVADSLVGADVRGHSSHGVIRIPWYLEAVGDAIRPDASPAVVRDGETTVSVDGRRAFGQIVGREAADLAADRAEKHGVAVVGIGGSPHIGRLGEWAERVADRGLIFGAFAKSRSFNVAPAGSADRLLPTNPIAWAIPTFDALAFDVVLDMATSQVAQGKIGERATSGEPVPEGWITDAAGEAVTDAAAYEAGTGAMLPLGGRTAGYKGTALSIVVELVSGIVADAPVAGEHDQPPTRNDAAFLAFDPTRFTTRERIEERVTALAEHVRGADYPDAVTPGEPAEGDRALLPGEAEFLRAGRVENEGLHVDDAVARLLCDVADDRGAERSIPDSFRDR